MMKKGLIVFLIVVAGLFLANNASALLMPAGDPVLTGSWTQFWYNNNYDFDTIEFYAKNADRTFFTARLRKPEPPDNKSYKQNSKQVILDKTLSNANYSRNYFNLKLKTADKQIAMACSLYTLKG